MGDEKIRSEVDTSVWFSFICVFYPHSILMYPLLKEEVNFIYEYHSFYHLGGGLGKGNPLNYNQEEILEMSNSEIIIRNNLRETYEDVFSPGVIEALSIMAPFNEEVKN